LKKINIAQKAIINFISNAWKMVLLTHLIVLFRG